MPGGQDSSLLLVESGSDIYFRYKSDGAGSTRMVREGADRSLLLTSA